MRAGRECEGCTVGCTVGCTAMMDIVYSYSKQPPATCTRVGSLTSTAHGGQLQLPCR